MIEVIFSLIDGIASIKRVDFLPRVGDLVEFAEQQCVVTQVIWKRTSDSWLEPTIILDKILSKCEEEKDRCDDCENQEIGLCEFHTLK